MMNDNKVFLYTISTCSHCKSTKKLLNDLDVSYESVEVDLLKGEERQKVIEDIKKINPRCSFPTICIDYEVIVGFHENQIKEALGLE